MHKDSFTSRWKVAPSLPSNLHTLIWLSSSTDRACVCSFGCSTQQCIPKQKRQKTNKKKCYLYCLGNVCSLHTKHNVVGNISHGCRLTSGLSQTHVNSPRGLMDKASVSEAEDCGFESRRGYDFCVWNIFKRWQTKNNIRIEWFWWDSNSHLCEVMYPLRLWCTMLSRGHNQAHSVRSSL